MQDADADADFLVHGHKRLGIFIDEKREADRQVGGQANQQASAAGTFADNPLFTYHKASKSRSHVFHPYVLEK